MSNVFGINYTSFLACITIMVNICKGVFALEKIFFTLLLVLLLASCGNETTNEPVEEASDNTDKVEEKVNETQKVEPVESKTLAPSVEEYETKFKGGLSMAFSPSSVEKLENGRYSISLDSDIFLFMDVNKDDEVIKVNIAASTDSFVEKKDKIKYAFVTSVKSADIELSDTQIDKLFDDLKITWDNNMLDQTEVKTLNEIKYTFKGDNEDGVVLLQTEMK